MAEQQNFTTSLSTWTNSFTELVEKDYEANGLVIDDYSKMCAMNAMSNMFQMVTTSGKDMNSISTSGIRDIVGECASLKLNANAVPKEVFFNIRNKKVGNSYVPTIELGLTVKAHESMLRNFGVNVKRVYDTWSVKEGDEFVYPKRKGLTVTDPEWNPLGKSLKTIRVVVPVELTDGTVTYLIAERESVKINLIAHIKQNLLNETFGICEDRYKANDTQKKQIAEKKNEILDAMKKCETLDEMLECEVIRPYLSGAWADTTESIIETKMVGNAIRKYPKDFNSLASKSLVELDEVYKQTQEEVNENANTEVFVESTVVESTATEVTE